MGKKGASPLDDDTAHATYGGEELGVVAVLGQKVQKMKCFCKNSPKSVFPDPTRSQNSILTLSIEC